MQKLPVGWGGVGVISLSPEGLEEGVITDSLGGGGGLGEVGRQRQRDREVCGQGRLIGVVSLIEGHSQSVVIPP